MPLVAKGEWRNPPASSADYERVSKAFQRLQTLLCAFVPLFQARIHPKLRDGGS